MKTFSAKPAEVKRDWYVIAPDQRGYGGTDATREAGGGYWFADYVGDLDALIDPSARVDFHTGKVQR